MANGLTLGDLQQTAIEYRKEFLQMPFLKMQDSLMHMTLRPGIRYREVVGQLAGNAQLAPYKSDRSADANLSVTSRNLEVFLGNVVVPFDPNSVYQSIWGSSMTKGEALKTTDVSRQVIAFIAAKLGENLNNVLWSAKRDDTGDASADLFNGFDTITDEDIKNNKIKADKGNFYQITEAISSTNAVDVLKTIYRKADVRLRDQESILYVSHDIYDAYCDDYQATVGAVPYNTTFDKTYLEGSRNKCTIVPMANKSESNYIHLSTKNNMLVGCDQASDFENISVEKYSPFVLSLVATMALGCQFESIDKARLFVAKLYSSQQPSQEPSQE